MNAKDVSILEDLMASLSYYVPTGTTEGEKHILQEAFIQTGEYADIIAPPVGSPRLLVGKKGSGKSAILDFTTRFLKQSKIPGVLVKPLDLDLSSMNEDSSSGELTRVAYHALIRTVSVAIGEQLETLVVGENRLLLEAAIAGGVKDLDYFSRFTRVLNSFSAPFTGFDFKELLPTTTEVQCKRLERAVKSNIDQSQKAFYLLIDDTDQVANPGTKGHLNRIWAVILAARELTQKNDKIRCVISLRDEIWRNLSMDNGGQRDQLDHFQPLVYQINPTLDHVQAIIEKRLVLASARAGNVSERPDYTLFFEGDSPRMPNSQARSSWPDIIRSRSRGRPRDAVQLVEKMVRLALQGEVKKIDDNILSTVMPLFSQERVESVSREFEAECPVLPQIIRTMSRVNYNHGSFLADSESIRSHLTSIQGSFSITFKGKILHLSDEDDLFELWALLFQAGIFYPRVSDKREKDGYRFILPNEQPGYVSKVRWNELQRALWEIHPVFRDFLIAIQKEETAGLGLATKHKSRNRRGK